MIAGANNVLPPWAESYLTDYMRSYDQCVLGKDGKTVTPIEYNPKKDPAVAKTAPLLEMSGRFVGRSESEPPRLFGRNHNFSSKPTSFL